MVLPEHLLPAEKKIQDTNLICAPVISQFAALGALQAGAAYCREKITELAEVRAIVSKSLSMLEDMCEVPRADGAFYFLLRLRTQRDPMELARWMVREHRVAVIPGTAFGMTGCYLRVSYGPLSRTTAAEGIGRLVSGLQKLLS
jgi:aspartate/methionine/tyrosine aminotransferase